MGQQARHGDHGAPERAVQTPELDLEVLHLVDALDDRRQDTLAGLARDDADAAGPLEPLGQVLGELLELVLNQRRHAHAVAELVVLAVVAVARDGHVRDQVELVAQPDDRVAVLVAEVLLPALQQLDRLAGLLLRDGRELGQIRPELSQPHRHHRDGQERRDEGLQVPERALELGAVVHARAEDHLDVEVDAVVREPLEVAEDAPGLGMLDHLDAQLGVGGVHADVQRAQPVLEDALPVRGPHVRQGDEVALQEAQPVVVVHDVERSPKPLRHLVDEAEAAAVVALDDVVEHRELEGEPEVLVDFFVHPHEEGGFAALDLEADALFGNLVAVVDDVAQRATVNSQETVPRTQIEPGSNAARLDGRDQSALRLTPRPATHSTPRWNNPGCSPARRRGGSARCGDPRDGSA
ncbi:hypothetical protein D3C72_1060330 [compost metagenome]